MKWINILLLMFGTMGTVIMIKNCTQIENNSGVQSVHMGVKHE